MKEIETYNIRGTIIGLFESETAYGWHTVAEINGHYHLLTERLCNIMSAIILWEKLNGTILSLSEVDEIMLKNNLKMSL